MFAGLIWNDRKDVLKSLSIPNRTIAQLKCLAPPNKSMVMYSKAKTLNVANRIIYSLHFGSSKLYFLKFQTQKGKYLTCQIHSVWINEMCSFAFSRFSNFCFLLHNLFHFCLLTVLWFWFKPSHCLPVTMWIYLSQRWNRANTSSFFVILERLNALSTFYVYFLFPLVTLHVFLYFCAFWKKTLLKEEFYLVKYEWRRGVVEFLTYHV